MKIAELLEGLGEYKLIGDFNKNHGFKEPDRRILQNPFIKEKLSKRLGHLPYTVNMFFVNLPKASKHTEVGMVNLDWVGANLGEKIHDEVEPTYQRHEHINIIYTNNKGAQRFPFTPWMMMHRMAHALARYDMSSPSRAIGLQRQFKDYSEAAKTLLHYTADILEMYGARDFPRSDSDLGAGYSEEKFRANRKNQLMMRGLWSKLATFRSAREGKIRDYFEILNELFAQYMMTGELKFNSPPSSMELQVGSGWGAKKYLRYNPKDEAVKSQIEDLLDGLANQLKGDFDNLLADTARGILVM